MRPFLAIVSIAFVSVSPLARAADAPPPSDWVDPRTGHRVIRLSPDSGGGSLYFHQRAYTPEGDKVLLRTREGIMAVDISRLGREAPRREVVLAEASPIAMAWRTREAYFFDRAENTLRAVHVDTRKVREVVRLPSLARGTQFAVNCDESQLILIGPDPEGKTVPRTPPAGGAGGTLEANWAAGTPKMISSIDTRTGAMRVLHRENDWTNHLQCSPTDPQEILFCHEGPWHFTNRTWTLRTDGGAPRACIAAR
jgi:oligogalacturonide lyase